MKKIFSLLGGVVIIASSVASCTFAYTQEQLEAYEWAYKYGITTQPTVESARLDGNLTRQAFSKMIVNYLENVIGIKVSTSNSCNIPDESNITSDLIPYVKKTCSYGIMGQNGSNFHPTRSLSRAHLGTVLSRVLRGDEYNTTGRSYYVYHLNALKYSGIMNRIDNPQESTKRGDVFVMLKRVYEKFGGNIFMNGIKSSAYSTQRTNFIGSREDSSDEFISNVYSNSNVIYTGKDGKKYYYDDKFLSMLQTEAEKKGESDLSDYLRIEAAYFKKGFDQLSDLDDEQLLKSLGIDVNTIDTEKMTKQEKQELINQFKTALSKIVNENKDKNNKLTKDLERITKNIKNDKFGLKEKLKETKTFMEASNTFLDQYLESITKLMEIALMEGEENSDESVAQAFGLIGTALVYEGEAEKYQQYVEKWGVDTVKLLEL